MIALDYIICSLNCPFCCSAWFDLTTGLQFRSRLVWPDSEIKSSPKFSKSCQKLASADITLKVIFNSAQKVTVHLGYFWKKICSQELSKIAQSGHTDYAPDPFHFQLAARVQQCDQMAKFFCSIFGHLQQIKFAQQQKFGQSRIIICQMLHKLFILGSKDCED